MRGSSPNAIRAVAAPSDAQGGDVLVAAPHGGQLHLAGEHDEERVAVPSRPVDPLTLRGREQPARGGDLATPTGVHAAEQRRVEHRVGPLAHGTLTLARASFTTSRRSRARSVMSGPLGRLPARAWFFS